MGADRQPSAIVLVVFVWGGLVVGYIRGVNLIGLVEDLLWLKKKPELDCGNLVHLLKFADVSCRFRCVGRARGQVFGQLDIY